ncbi:hypothetical protein BDR04DRAFT_1164948 [Suillus decipiens]|nr:hypothetical protein BDR04DRAFT_1164948 [Suillus decipiens]
MAMGVSAGSAANVHSLFMLDGPSSVAQTQHARVIPSNMDAHDTGMPPVQGREQHPPGDLSALIPDDITNTPSNTPRNHTPDPITQYEHERDIHCQSPSDPIAQFPAAAEEGGQSTGEDNSIQQSLLSLANVQRAIRAYRSDSISFNELCSVLLTDTPPIHVQTVHATLRMLHPGHANTKTLDVLFQKLQEEEVSARRLLD